jgi:hypothetical protein
MTAIAIRVRGGEAVVVARVAIRAGHDFARGRQLVRARQCPAGCGVVKHYVRPQGGVVACGTIGGGKRRARRRVRRIVGLLPGRQVASGIPAVRRADLQIVIIVEVAVRAGSHLACRRQLVRVRQRKTSGRVIKIGRQPGNRIVTSRARRNRKHCRRRRMFRVRRLLPRRQMASRVPAVRRCDLQIEVVANMAI